MPVLLDFCTFGVESSRLLQGTGIPLVKSSTDRLYSAVLAHGALTTTIRYLSLKDENLKQAGEVPSEQISGANRIRRQITEQRFAKLLRYRQGPIEC